MLYDLENKKIQNSGDNWVAPNANVIGDVILEKNAIEELLLASSKLSNFTILAPLEKNFANYGMFGGRTLNKSLDDAPFKVDFVDGFAMLLNKKQITQ